MAPTPMRPTVGRSVQLFLTLPAIIAAVLCCSVVAVAMPLGLVPAIALALLVAAIGAGVAAAIYRRIAHQRLVAPLQRIADITNAIADGAVSGRIELDRGAALDTVRVADAINRLAHRAAKDIDEMRRLERVRSEFVANVSHELRTPIFSVQGYLETLLDGAMDDPEVSQQFLEKAYNNALRLNTLLSDLIDISRIESGELKFSFRYFDVADLLHDVVQATEMRASQSNVTVHCSAPTDVQVYGDRERISQVVTNLLENAVKYNVDGGNVYVDARPVEGGVRIGVRDTGLGISEEHLPRIFERFYRVDKDRSRAVGGTGLGLAIVKHILEAHHAPMSVQSEIGKGTEITFVLKS